MNSIDVLKSIVKSVHKGTATLENNEQLMSAKHAVWGTGFLDEQAMQDMIDSGGLPEANDSYIELLSAQLHDVYQKEAHRRGDVRHPDSYADLSDETKEWDRVLARWITKNFIPKRTTIRLHWSETLRKWVSVDDRP